MVGTVTKILFAVLAHCLCAIGFASSGLAKPSEPTLKIGVVLPLSGAHATVGIDSMRGIELSLEKLASIDPAFARRIILVKEDEKSNPIDAVAAAKKLLHTDKVDIILGSIASSHTLAITGEVNKAGKILMTPGSTNPTVTQAGEMIFRSCFIDSFQGSVVARFALENLSKKKAAILFDHKSDYSIGFAEHFTKTFVEGGGEIVAREAYEAGKKDFKTQLVKIRASRPEVLLVPGYYQEVGLIMKQAQQMGYKVPMLGGDGWDSPALFEIAGKEAAQGHYFSTHFSTDDTDPMVKNFVASYRAKYKTMPSGLAALGYDALSIIADAFKRAGSSDPKTLQKALASTKNLRVVTGVITINSSRDAEKDAVILKTGFGNTSFSARISPGIKK